MMGSILGTAQHGCGHHWHVVEAGWQCCGCPDRVKASQAPPAPGDAPCTGPHDDVPSIADWLAPAGR